MSNIFGTNSDDTLTGTEDDDNIIAQSGNDDISAGGGNDYIDAGLGNDTVDAGAGNDFVTAGGGEDTIRGGAGDDYIDAGADADIAIYNVSDNVGSTDFYDGADGTDTLRLELTKAEWFRADIQADIANYLTALSQNQTTYVFQSFGLTAKKFENLEIFVDGVQLTPEDDPVNALDDIASVNENSSVSGNAILNDSAPDLIKTIILTQNVTRGTLSFNTSDGSYTFTANEDFDYLAVGETTTETFEYQIEDADGDTDTATVTVTVTGTNDAPIVSGPIDAGTSNEDAAPVVIDLLANASDDDDTDDIDTDTVTVSSSNSSRTVLFSIVDETGTLTIDPAQFNDLAVGESETLSVTYNVIDNNGGITPTSATLIVEGRNDAPSVLGPIDAGTTNEDAAPVVIDLLANASDDDTTDDIDTDSVAVTSGNPSRTVLFSIVDETGTLTIDPAQFNDLAVGESETLSVTYNVIDNNGGITPTSATLIVEGRNDAPSVLGPIDAGTTNEDAAPVVIDLLANASDDDTTDDIDTDSVAVTSGNPSRTVLFSIVDETGTLTIDPAQFNDLALGESETLSVTYNVIDNNGGITPTFANLIVEGRNDAPTVSGPIDAGTTNEDAAPVVIDLLANASDDDTTDDIDTDSVAVTSSNPSRTVLFSIVDETGTLTIDPAQFNDLALGESETLSVTYNVIDNNGGITPTFANLIVEGRNDAPTVSGPIDAGTTNEDAAPVVIDLLANASDDDTTDDIDTDSVAITSSNPSRTVLFSIVDETGTLTIDPAQFNDLALGESETLSVTYNVIDNNGGITPTFANLIVEGRNDAPTVSGPIDAGTTNEDAAPVVIDLLANASDDDDSDTPFVTNIVATDSIGNAVTFTDNGNGTITIDPDQFGADLVEGESRTVTISYDVTDGVAFTATTASLVVEGRNDGPVLVAAFNVGGADYLATGSGIQYSADPGTSSGSVQYRNKAGTEITGTDDDVLYQTYAFGSLFGYDIAVSEPGDYIIQIELTEPFWTSEGGRIFDIVTEGTAVGLFDDIDVFSHGGTYGAVTLTETVTVTDGVLNIEFDASMDNALVSAIAVFSTGTLTPPSVDLATDDTATVDEDQSVLIDVLANDDVTASIDSVAAAMNGTVVIENGQIRYTPDADFFGIDSFTYTVTDGADTDTATVTVDVASVEEETGLIAAINVGGGDYLAIETGIQYSADPGVSSGPVQYRDKAGTEITGTVDDTLYQTYAFGSLFGYDIAVSEPGDYLIQIELTEPFWTSEGGRIFDIVTEGIAVGLFDDVDVFSQGGTFGAVTLTETVTVTDGVLNIEFDASMDNALVSAIAVFSAETTTPPVVDLAGDDSATVAENDTILIDVLANDDATATIDSLASAANGTVVVESGQIRYTPDADFFGIDSFTYSVTDGTNTDTATVTVDVTEVVEEESNAPIAAFNIGGSDYLALETGTQYSADPGISSGSVQYRNKSGNEIAGTEDDALYQTYAFGDVFSFDIAVPEAGNYVVEIELMETFWTSAGNRLFDIALEGTAIGSFDDIDPYAISGGLYTAVTLNETVSVTDGILNINFDASIDNAVISAISIWHEDDYLV